MADLVWLLNRYEAATRRAVNGFLRGIGALTSRRLSGSIMATAFCAAGKSLSSDIASVPLPKRRAQLSLEDLARR
jgi:hypothetical protein